MQGFLRAASVAALTALLIIVWSCADNSRKVKLELKFQTGRELTYEQLNSQRISMNNSTVSSPVARSKGEMVQKVTDLTPDGGKIEETSTWSWSEKDSIGVIRVVSTTEKLSYQMATNGKVSGLEILSDEQAAKWKEYAQSNFEQSQPTFPDEPVGKDYSWMQTVKIFLPTGEKLDASTSYEVTDFVNVDGHKCVVIDYKGNMVLPFDVTESDTLTQRGVDKVDVTGTLLFDYQNGYVYSEEQKKMVTAERSKILANQATNYTAFIQEDQSYHLKSVK